MTDFPSPSGRPEGPKSSTFGRFRSVLFVLGTLGLAVGGLTLDHRLPSLQSPPVSTGRSIAPGADLNLPKPDLPPPVGAGDLKGGDPKAVNGDANLKAGDLKGFQLKPPDPAAEPEPPASDLYTLTLRLERGDTVEKLLAASGVAEADRKQVADRLRDLLKKRKLAVGETFELIMQTQPEQPDVPRLLSLSVRPQPEREYFITRRDDGSYEGEEKVYKVAPRLVRVDGERHGPLEQSGVKVGAPSAAMIDFVRALAYDVDFQRELKEGQRFTLLLEQLVTSDGHVTHPGRFVAGELRLLKRTVTVIRYRPQGGAEGFYNPQGESIVRSFLRTPMDASRITSRFGLREHPILGFSALHTGVDFAAPPGTPILAAGTGRVVMAGPNGGYGNYVRLQHTSDVATAYAHMSRLGPGVRPGVVVRQGQVIGFVGSTGLSTGPHLHYEFHRGGKPVNPLAQKFAMRASLGGKDAQQFQALVRHYLAQLRNAPSLTDVSAKPKEASSSPASGGG
ncbi:MAG: peptidoglycan DD-metalloendopeptidase family protein [Alphaproteobacteria bacterium]|nr:peptidoglycan DD-metalloendopeptidase family protein [Alphaproteobacteria bacterium]